jgi:tetratricopeptide (TPR) repeat protein
VAPLVIGTSSSSSSSSSPIAALADGPGPAHTDGALAPSPLAVPARDPRAGGRGRALVITELSQLEQIFASTPKASAQRPLIARRLADTYAELTRVSEGAVNATAHKKALSHYELITTEYPQDAHVDEAYYYAGLEHELSGNVSQARRAYFELIRQAPQSKLVPLAYFAFAEMFFAEGANDASKNALAEQAFREVLKYPAAQNPVHADAKRRLAELAARQRP